jgi:PAS domain S-box-containing protein
VKTEHKILAASLICGLLFWLVDAAFDAFTDAEAGFGRMLIAPVRSHDLYVRLIVVAGFLVFGAVLARVIAGHRRAADDLRAALRTNAAILDSMSEPVIYLDRHLTIRWMNRAAAQFGGRSRAVLVGRPHEDAWPERQEPDGVAGVLRAVESGRPQETEAATANGRTLWVHAYPVPGADGTVEGVIEVVQDITERRCLQDRLHQAQIMHAVGALASGIAHDFNNLLTAILGYAGLAKSALPEDHPARASLEMTQQAARQAGGVTESLFAFSGKGATDPTTVNLVEVIDESIRLLEPRMPARLEIVKEATPDEPAWVTGDAIQLQQLVAHLVENAADAMPQGGRVRIRLERGPMTPANADDAGAASAEARTGVILTVADDGTGMSEEVRARAFEPFFTTKPRGRKAGLGLAIVHAIVRGHGGTVRIESEPDKGTQLVIGLPGCDAPAERLSPPVEPEPATGQGKTVLVVGGDDHVRSIVTSMLRSRGYEVIPASDGGEAMQALRPHGPGIDLVVLDMDLPRQGGASCMRELRDAGVCAPMILLTDRECRAAHAPDIEGLLILRKPFQLSDLSALVGRALSCVEVVRGEAV